MPKTSATKKTLYLYLISHNRSDIKTHTYVGCVEKFIKRLQQHNGQLQGGPRITRRAAGSWDPVVVLKLPKDRTFDSKKLKKEWKQSSRGLESRIRKGFSIALQYNLTCYIMKSRKNTKGIKIFDYLDERWDESNIINLNEEDWTKITTNNFNVA